MPVRKQQGGFHGLVGGRYRTKNGASSPRDRRSEVQQRPPQILPFPAGNRLVRSLPVLKFLVRSGPRGSHRSAMINGPPVWSLPDYSLVPHVLST